MLRALRVSIFSAALTVVPLSAAALASDLDEFEVKREQVCEFAEKPSVTRQGDKVTITFTSKALCDATVAIENADGKRHFNYMTGTVVKFTPKKSKILSTVKGLVPMTEIPKGHADLGKGGLRIWADGAREERRCPVVVAILGDGVEERW